MEPLPRFANGAALATAALLLLSAARAAFPRPILEHRPKAQLSRRYNQ
jgi:hypothetical protein